MNPIERSSSMASGSESTPGNGPGKQKKTRRRLRLSCVECTKRRQKCDRQSPCGLCVTRGVTHLCRWESVPVARPSPARPPANAKFADPPSESDRSTIERLSARIADLEQIIIQNQMQIPPSSPSESNSPSALWQDSTDSPIPRNPSPLSSSFGPSPSPSPNGFQSPQELEDEESTKSVVPLTKDLHDATVALAQLTMAHQGEYIGCGSIVSTLHKLGRPEDAQFTFAQSTDPIWHKPDLLYRMNWTTQNQIQTLIHHLPSPNETSILIQAFFEQANWRYGVPEEWFHMATAQMWNALTYPGQDEVRININWLSLLFAVLTQAIDSSPLPPLPGDSVSRCDLYFRCGLAACRISEEACLMAPTFSPSTTVVDGVALSCLAAPMFSGYLSERGRVSEAWKLLGNAMRTAQAVGMHRDPSWKCWKAMSDDEKTLRTTAWWGIVALDQCYSFVLGRPSMTRQGTFDVRLPPPKNLDGSVNWFNVFQTHYVLLANIAGEGSERCFDIPTVAASTIATLEAKCVEWEKQLPPELSYLQGTTFPAGLNRVGKMALSRQRRTVGMWLLVLRMKLHLSFISQLEKLPTAVTAPLRESIKRSTRLCVAAAQEYASWRLGVYGMKRTPTALLDSDQALVIEPAWSHEDSFPLFDAGVCIIMALTQMPKEERTVEAEAYVARMIGALTDVAREECGYKGDIVRKAIGVLSVLSKETNWRSGLSTQVLSYDMGTKSISNANTFTAEIQNPAREQYYLLSPSTQYLIQSPAFFGSAEMFDFSNDVAIRE